MVTNDATRPGFNDEGVYRTVLRGLDLTEDDLFYGYSLTIQSDSEGDFYSPRFDVRECQMCGAVVSNETLHLKFHRNSAAPKGFEPGDHNPAWSTLGRWTD